MAEKNITEILEKEITKIKEKKSKIYFFVYDTKGAPNGSLAYIYESAYSLHKKGYNVQFLYAEKEFVGVESWLGEEYSNLPHFSVEKDNIDVSFSDILIIPEVCVSVMSQTKELPCKRIVLIQNFNYLTEAMPMGVNFDDLKIRECITTNNSLKEKIEKLFPYMKVHVVTPALSDFFYEKPQEPRNLIVNVISKNSADINSILKPFYWKYPMYSWVAFREVKNISKKDFAKALKESFATIWVDTNTNFGYSALEAMACGNIVIGKVPEDMPEWIKDEDGNLIDSGVWFYNNGDAQDLIAGVIQSFITNGIPSQIYDNMEKTANAYKKENDFDKLCEEIFNNREKEASFLINAENNNKENEDK